VLDDARAKEIDKAAREEAAEAIRFADQAPAPSVGDIVSDVYWESDNDTPASRIGRHFFEIPSPKGQVPSA
jgi:TPP-dependent pyruvate/acetoin dehydrogenase alpha subunit